MKVIVCGAGQVGFDIARHLSSEGNDVTVIDQRPDLIRKMNDTLDVRCVLGSASFPAILESAGASDTDMIIAVTAQDEVNMLACQVAHSLFKVPTKIARVREQAYLQPVYSDLYTRENLPIDAIISPEIEVARAIIRRLSMPGAIDMIPLAGDKVRLIGVRCMPDCPLLNTPLRQLSQLFPDLNVIIVAVVRDGLSSIPQPDFQLIAGDEAYFIVDSAHVARAMTAFGHEEQEARSVVIFGGGNIGLFLARQIEKLDNGMYSKMVEINRQRAEFVAQSLKNTLVLNGDALDSAFMEEVGIQSAETAIAVTNDDETNILTALLAKRQGCKRVIALVNKIDYASLSASLGIDVVVLPRAITVSSILQHVRKGRIHAVHSLQDGFGELIEADALETSGLVGRPLKDIDLPEGVMVGAIVHDGLVIKPRSSTIIEKNDRVILFAAAEAVKKVEKMFSVSLEFF